MPLTNTSNTIVRDIVSRLLNSLHPDIRAHYEAGETAKAARDARADEGTKGLPPSFVANIKKVKDKAKKKREKEDKNGKKESGDGDKKKRPKPFYLR